MKAIRTKEVNENVKAANSCLRKAKWQAKELAVFTGEVVRLMDKEGILYKGSLIGWSLFWWTALLNSV